MLAQQIVNGLMLGAIYVFVAIAFTFIVGVLNFANFGIPAFFMLGSMVTWAAIRLSAPPPLALACGLLSGGVASLIVERVTYRRLRAHDPVIPLIASLAFLVFFENLAFVLWGTDQHSFPAIGPSFTLRFFGLVFGGAQLISLFLSLGLAMGLSLVLQRSGFGRAVRAIAEDADTAAYLGIRVERIVPMLFFAVGIFAALGGILFSVNYLQTSAYIGQEVGLKGVAAMVVGGLGNVWGSVIGGMLIGVAEVLALTVFGAGTVDIAVYGLLLLILIAKPSGLLGSGHSARERL